jgi:flagellar FliJ protein
MSKHSTLDTLATLARERTEGAVRRLGLLNSAKSQADSQLSMLYDYRQDYLSRLQNAMQAGMPASDCRNYQRFVSTLDEAISQQNGVLVQTEDELLAGRHEWRHEQKRLNAFDALTQRMLRAQALVQGRREQAINDEHAAQLVRRQQSA